MLRIERRAPLTFTLVQVRDPEEAHKLMEQAGIGIDAYAHDPVTRHMVFESAAGLITVQSAAHRQGLKLSWTTKQAIDRA